MLLIDFVKELKHKSSMLSLYDSCGYFIKDLTVSEYNTWIKRNEYDTYNILSIQPLKKNNIIKFVCYIEPLDKE